MKEIAKIIDSIIGKHGRKLSVGTIVLCAFLVNRGFNSIEEGIDQKIKQHTESIKKEIISAIEVDNEKRYNDYEKNCNKKIHDLEIDYINFKLGTFNQLKWTVDQMKSKHHNIENPIIKQNTIISGNPEPKYDSSWVDNVPESIVPKYQKQMIKSLVEKGEIKNNLLIKEKE